MDCPSCHAENRPGRKFCAQCGALLAIACPACRAPNEPGERFCGECGGSLGLSVASDGGAGAKQPAIPPPTERRLVSVLFADLVGFTSLSDNRDPEDVRDLLTRYFDTSRQIVERYGGTVDKFIGDAVVAVWGTPTAHEDDAERAVRAGFDLTDAVAALGNEVQNAPLALRAAVGSGHAAVVVGAAGQGMVAGDLVNTASRLQAAALPGGLLVDEGTYRAASRAILFEALGDQVLKGKALPVPAWRALRVVAARRGAGRTERLEAPFVGRDEELRLLKGLFHATAREKRARLISIVGQAGIGKSRLAWEFEKYIDGLAQEVYWHHGRSPSYGEGITFWSLGEMVRRRAGIAETDDAETTRKQLTAALADYVPDDDDRRWLAAPLAALLGLEEPPAGEREQLFAAWRTFFERVAQRGPTVMVFEDLQWADQGVLDFIEHILQWSRAYPILIITLARPELRERRPSWGIDQRNFTALHLEPLAGEPMAQLLTGLVPGLPDSVLDQIVTRAEGVPLYAVETVRMLLDERQLIADDGEYRLAGKISQLAVPATLHALINARLDGLPAEERALLQLAAVLGNRFTLPALTELRAEPEDRLLSRVNSLVRKELLVYDADPRSPERGQYGFVQSLIREIAYDTLPKRERRERHQAVARYFEELADPELAAVVASHYLAAYQATPEGPAAQALKEKARASLRSAAERAAALHSHDQALAYLEQTLAITDDEAERAALWELAGTSAEIAARFDAAEGYLRKASAWFRDQGDRAATVRTVAQLARVLNAVGRPEAAIAILEEAYAEFKSSEADPVFVALIAQLARAYFLHGEFRRALEWAENTLAAAGPLNLLPVIVDTLITRGSAIGDAANRQQEGLSELMGALAMAQAHGLVTLELRARNNIAAWHLIDDPRIRLATGRAGFELARKLGHRDWVHSLAGHAMDAAVLTGDWDWALALFAELEEEDLPFESLLPAFLGAARIKAFRGDSTVGGNRIATMESVVASWTNPQWASILPAKQSVIALAAGDLDASYGYAMRSVATSRGDLLAMAVAYEAAARAALWLRDRARTAEAVRTLDTIPVHGAYLEATRQEFDAGLLALEGRVDDAVAAYDTAARRFREIELPFSLALCQLEAAMLIGPDRPEARAAADEAREIFTRLGSPPMLERLNSLLQETPSPVRK
jgi:class 3 adenylate cyclase/tetratricopeptide (TPR) repeat protein